jgi:hypothetical protein
MACSRFSVSSSSTSRSLIDDLDVAEQVGQVRRDDVLDRHEPVLRHGQEPGQQRRHLDPGEHRGVGARIRDHDGEVEGQAGDERERMRRVDHQRSEHRVDAFPEQVTEVVPFGRRQFLPAQDLDPALDQLRADALAEGAGVPDGQLTRELQGVLQHLPRQLQPGALDREPGHHPAHQPGHPDHEELVQVGREDGEEPHAFQQRDRFVLGELEYALVESEPAFLPIQVPFRG